MSRSALTPHIKYDCLFHYQRELGFHNKYLGMRDRTWSYTCLHLLEVPGRVCIHLLVRGLLLPKSEFKPVKDSSYKHGWHDQEVFSSFPTH